jgi:putative MFS transporter
MARLTDQQKVSITVLVAALGYFVDVFDLQLFSMLRISSLKSLGLEGDQLTIVGAQLLNWQMAGMLVGGILWGILGDRKGRVYVLFGTILLYSLGNIANAFVTTIPEYAAARFFTGLGLAGEIGAGVTLASELLPKAKRSYGCAVIVGFGVIGPLAAGLMTETFDWRTCYIGGGVLGLMLLLLRVSVNESGMFHTVSKQVGIGRGKFFMLFNNRKRFSRYICSIGCALPIWFNLSVIVIFSPEIGTALNIPAPLRAVTAVMACYIGMSIGGFLTGYLSQILQSRKLVMAGSVALLTLIVAAILHAKNISPQAYYGMILVTGLFSGYWTVFMASAAEQFGTNIRNTATSTAPNFVRASVIIDTLLVSYLTPQYGMLTSIEIAGALCVLVSTLAIWKLPETFSRDLDFIER